MIYFNTRRTVSSAPVAEVTSVSATHPACDRHPRLNAGQAVERRLEPGLNM